METALDVPLLLLLVLAFTRGGPVTPGSAARLGLLASLAILARLDIALVVPIAFLGWLWFARPPRATVLHAVLAFCAAGIAVPLYAAWNLVTFGSVLPVSALSKQLVLRPGINVSYEDRRPHTVFGATAGLCLLVLGVFALLGLWRRRKLAVPPAALFAAAVLLAFTALFYGLNSLSGWMFFGWYAYPLGPALVAALVLVGTVVATRIGPRWRTRASAAIVAAAAVLALVQGTRAFATRGPQWSVRDNGLLGMSVELADRMHEHHGVYSMGAVSGFVTYLLHEPVVQLEGLVADRAMSDHIGRQDFLGDVLRTYRVDYLVVTVYRATLEKHDGCYRVTQPNAEWSGERVARMSGDLCEEPVDHFFTRAPAHPWSIFHHPRTYVFDVRNALARADARSRRATHRRGRGGRRSPGAGRTRNNDALEQDPSVPPQND
jgi:hypothetical protein